MRHHTKAVIVVIIMVLSHLAVLSACNTQTKNGSSKMPGGWPDKEIALLPDASNVTFESRTGVQQGDTSVNKYYLNMDTKESWEEISGYYKAIFESKGYRYRRQMSSIASQYLEYYKNDNTLFIRVLYDFRAKSVTIQYIQSDQGLAMLVN